MTLARAARHLANAHKWLFRAQSDLLKLPPKLAISRYTASDLLHELVLQERVLSAIQDLINAELSHVEPGADTKRQLRRHTALRIAKRSKRTEAA